MADHVEDLDKKQETMMEKITEKFHSHDEGGSSSSSSSSSDSDSEKKSEKIPKSSAPSSPPSSSTMKEKMSRLFGREKPVHKVLGGGKPADVFLWRNKKISAVTLGGATLVWVLFEFMEYHLLTLVCHILILVLAMSFLWSNATTFINKSPPRIPEVRLAEEPFVQTAVVLRAEINSALTVLREIASGRDLKKFLIVIAGLWFFSILGSCCNFLTLFYITFVLLHTIPVLYEKYEDKVDRYADKAMIEIKKQYAVFDERVVKEVLSKIPRSLKNKKRD